ncbi:MAG: AMP-binding protein [Oscillospiraceae bacterium]
MEKMTMKDFVGYIAQYGDKTAYRYLINGEVAEKSYRQLAEDCTAVASWLAQNGVFGQHIAVMGSASYEWITAYLGVTMSANIAVPLDKMLPTEEICNLIRMGDVSMMFISPEFEANIGEYKNSSDDLSEIISFADKRFAEIKAAAPVQLPDTDENSLAELIFTSGTTGTGKGVMLTHKNLISNVRAIKEAGINKQSPAVAMSVLPIHHTFELTVNNLAILYTGETICINDSLENIIKNMQLFKPTIMLVVPMMADLFAKKIKDALNDPVQRKKFEAGLGLCRGLKKVGLNAERQIFAAIHKKFGGRLNILLVGGAPLRDETAELLSMIGLNVYQGYGMTETAPVISTNSPVFGNKIGSVGRLVQDTEVRIKDGEIQVKSPSVMAGYYKNPEATAQAFDEGWLKTGDLGYLDDDGILYITGRKKNLIILDNGKNVYPEELEEQLNSIPCIKEAMVYQHKGKICAMLQLVSSTEKEAAKDAVRALNAKMPTYKKISGITFRVSDFPKTTTLKIKRGEVMQEILASEQKRSEYHPPRTDAQRQICEVFERVLGKTGIGITDDFFESGGDSLCVLEAAAELGIQAQDIYDYSTPLKLADSISRASQADEDRVENINALIEQTISAQKSDRPKKVLLTGATGYLGAHILRELLKNRIEVVCLVRNPQKPEAVLKYYFPSEYQLMRYDVVAGNIERENLGLDEQTYEKLCGEIDAVIHTAANVHHTGKYEDFERANVIGTQNVIAFCARSGAFLHHTSTASVSGAGTVRQENPNSVFTEKVLDIGQHYTENVYIRSKYRAEEKVILARKNGLRANIYRIGNLTWRFKDGVFQRNSDDNGFLSRCRGIMKIGAYCSELDVFPIDLTPVDLCAAAYVKLVISGDENQIYHLFNPNMIYIRNIRKRLRCALVPKQIFEKRMLEKMADKDVAVLSFYSMIASSSENIETTCGITENKLKELGFVWPKIKLGYLKYMLKIK